MALVSEDRLLSLFDLPVQLPQARIPAGGYLAVATVKLDVGQTLDLRWLQIYVASMESSNLSDPCGVASLSTLNPSFAAGSLATLFLINNWAPTSDPWSQTVLDYLACPSDPATAPTALAPVSAVRPLVAPLSITAPGVYTFVILNNTTNRNLHITVDGVVTVDTEAA